MRIRAWTAAVAAAAVGAVRDRQPSTEVTWVAEHRDVLMLAGAGVGVLLLLFTSLSLVGSLVLIVVFGVYELVIYRAGAGAGCGRFATRASAGGSAVPRYGSAMSRPWAVSAQITVTSSAMMMIAQIGYHGR
jgi:hypothetical protein